MAIVLRTENAKCRSDTRILCTTERMAAKTKAQQRIPYWLALGIDYAGKLYFSF